MKTIGKWRWAIEKCVRDETRICERNGIKRMWEFIFYQVGCLEQNDIQPVKAALPCGCSNRKQRSLFWKESMRTRQKPKAQQAKSSFKTQIPCYESGRWANLDFESLKVSGISFLISRTKQVGISSFKQGILWQNTCFPCHKRHEDTSIRFLQFPRTLDWSFNLMRNEYELSRISSRELTSRLSEHAYKKSKRLSWWKVLWDCYTGIRNPHKKSRSSHAA